MHRYALPVFKSKDTKMIKTIFFSGNSVLVSKVVVFIYLAIGLLASFIANDVPIVCYDDTGVHFPIFSKKLLSFHEKQSFCLWPIIPYSSHTIDIRNQSAVSPFDHQNISSIKYRHWMGTDAIGRDVLAGLIHGTKTSLQVGFLSVLFSFIIGVTLGIYAAYFKDDEKKINLWQLLLSILMIFLLIFYSVNLIMSNIYSWIHLGLVWMLLIGLWLMMYRWLSKVKTGIHFNVHFDSILIKLIEIRKSFPGLFILLALTTIFSTPSVWNIVCIITFLGWTEFARYARAETMAIKAENYIISAKMYGINHWRIMIRHILPNLMPTLIVVACFSISGAIMLESTLSFLGIGLPVESVTWGKLMADGKNLRTWWIVVFPGLALFILILALNSMAEWYQKKYAS